MPGLKDPLPRTTALLLREAVRQHVGSERRRRFAPVVHVGRPGVREWCAPATVCDSDHASRTDVMAALLGHAGPQLVWLTRPGVLEPHDADVAWLGPSASAWAEAGEELVWVVVTRRGWWDPRSGLRREWRRLRP